MRILSFVHNILMVGPPGAGKTANAKLARAMPSILPRMTIEEALDVTRIYSVADQLPPDVGAKHPKESAASRVGDASPLLSIAYLAGAEQIGPSHLAEALQYRPRMLESG